MDIQNVLLCVLYILLILAHSYTLTKREFHRKLISIFSAALVLQTIYTILITLIETTTWFTVTHSRHDYYYYPHPHHHSHSHSHSHQQHHSNSQQQAIFDKTVNKEPQQQLQPQIVNNRNSSAVNLKKQGDITIDFTVLDFAQLMHVISINLLILFLLIIAKGWPITRRDMPFKYAFAIFWLICISADLMNFLWAYLEVLGSYMYRFGMESATNVYSTDGVISNLLHTSINDLTTPSTLNTTITKAISINESSSSLNITGNIITSHSVIDSKSHDNQLLEEPTESYDPSTRKVSLLIRVIIMMYFLLELRKTMILEQEQRKLQFYLHFGALTMVWFVHSFIVYGISLRVNKWQGKLITGFSSAADFLAFAVVVRLLWPLTSRSYLFKKCNRQQQDELLQGIPMTTRKSIL